MASYRWVVLGADGAELRVTEEFESKEEAEAWMGAHWSELLDEGGLSVRLEADEASVYDMGLTEG
jgi:hypothetical protein